MKRIAHGGIGLALMLGLAGIPAGAQDQSPSTSQSSGESLGQYARQVRKSPDAKAKPRVFDNDNLPTQDKLSVVGKPADVAQAAPAESQNVAPANEPQKSGADAKPANGDSAPTPAKAPEDEATKQAAWKQWGDRIVE